MGSSITTYRFRHPDGFSPEMFACFQAQCRLWSARLRAYVEGWKDLYLGSLPAPKYEFHGPNLSADRMEVSFGVGGERSYGQAKMFEDELPKDLWQFFPLSFQERLEYECVGNWYTISSVKESEWKETLRIARMLADQARKSPS